MRMIKIGDYDEKTMVLAKPVYDSMGRVLLNSGRTINQNFLSKLVQVGISHLIIEDEDSSGITLDDMLDMPQWMDYIFKLKEIFDSVANKKPIPILTLQRLANELINEIKQRKTILLVPSTYIGKELILYAHSVNVTLLSLQTANSVGYNDLQLRDLAIGSLLHDIGKAVTEDAKKHPEEGFNIIRANREISLLSAHVAMQHHEAIDGSGYPRGISDIKFLEYAQICGIANLYENLIHKQNVPPHEAIEIIMTKSGKMYSFELIRAFTNSVPAYLPGTKVELSTKEIGIVTKVKQHLHRPVVRIFHSGKEVSLANNPTVMITKYYG